MVGGSPERELGTEDAMNGGWSAFFLPPVGSSDELTQRSRMLYFMLAAFFPGALITGLINLANGWRNEATVLLILAGVSLVGFILLQIGRVRLAALMLCAMLIVAIDASLYYGASLFDAGVIAFPAFILCVTFLFGNTWGLFLATLAAISSIAGLYLLEQTGVIHPTLPASLLRVIVLSFLLAIIALIIRGVRESWESNLQHVQESYDLTLEGWARILDLRDGKSGGHTRRAAELTALLAQRMRCSPEKVTAIRRGAFLHDIGKMSIPDRILMKTGPLSAEEWETMRRHSELGYAFVSGIPFLREAADIPYRHHEHWDGSGYPGGLRGEEIPLAARIFAVVDTWDALHSDRPYRKAWEGPKIETYIRENSGKLFDPRVVEMFMTLVAEGKTESYNSRPPDALREST